jgi:hypothetical protein
VRYSGERAKTDGKQTKNLPRDVERDDAASPTALTESILITATIDAKQKRDVMTANIPNAFVQTNVDKKNQVKGEHIIMINYYEDTRTSCGYVNRNCTQSLRRILWTYEGKTKVLYVKMLKAIYGMPQSSLLYYKKFHKDIESVGFEVNPYNPCVAKRIVNGHGNQHTVSSHIDNLKSVMLTAK